MPRTVLRPKSLEFQPRPTFPYSPGAKGGNYIFTAGQVAWDQNGDVVAHGDVTQQTVQTLDNVKSVLEEGGASLDDVVKCNVYLKDIADFQAMNAVFARYFPKAPPARTTVQALLAEPEMLVEIEAIAYME